MSCVLRLGLLVPWALVSVFPAGCDDANLAGPPVDGGDGLDGAVDAAPAGQDAEALDGAPPAAADAALASLHDAGDRGDSGDAAVSSDAGTLVGLCDSLACEPGSCDLTRGTCRCGSGRYFDGAGCSETRPCLGAGTCTDICPIPDTPRFDVIAANEVLRFTAGAGATLQVGVASDPTLGEPDSWEDSDSISLSGFSGQLIRVFARTTSASCTAAGFFNALYDVRETYPGAAGSPGSRAVAGDDPAIEGWASSVVSITYGTSVDEAWKNPQEALGPAEGTALDVVTLGQGGVIVLGFDGPIADGVGADFAVFENAFGDTFLELGRVEVSSDGSHFVAFDGASQQAVAIGAYGTLEPTRLHAFAGSYRQGFGTPFDLAMLRQHASVVSGELDLDAITHVRIVDIIGDGNENDAFGRPVFDPFPGTGSGGFDLDAVAVLHFAP